MDVEGHLVATTTSGVRFAGSLSERGSSLSLLLTGKKSCEKDRNRSNKGSPAVCTTFDCKEGTSEATATKTDFIITKYTPNSLLYHFHGLSTLAAVRASARADDIGNGPPPTSRSRFLAISAAFLRSTIHLATQSTGLGQTHHVVRSNEKPHGIWSGNGAITFSKAVSYRLSVLRASDVRLLL